MSQWGERDLKGGGEFWGAVEDTVYCLDVSEGGDWRVSFAAQTSWICREEAACTGPIPLSRRHVSWASLQLIRPLGLLQAHRSRAEGHAGHPYLQV